MVTTQVDPDVDLSDYNLCLNRDGYVQFCCKGKNVLLHRYVLGLKTGDGLEVDHVDQDKTNNQRVNLRIVTRRQNIHNFPLTKRNTSGFKGITKTKNGKWLAQMQSKVNGKKFNRSLGTFATKEGAARAWDAAARLRGPCQSLNFK